MSEAYRTEYRDFVIFRSVKPIAIRDWDWDWVHKDYDGPEDGRAGFAESEQAARESVDEWHADNA